MSYTDTATVRLVLSSVNEETGGTAADLSDPQIQYEIDSAAAVIDSYLRVQYVVPFAEPVPFIIKSICTDIAAYRSDLNYRKSREYDSQNMPIIQRYNMAMASLGDLQCGKQTIPAPRENVSDQGAIIVHQYPVALFDFDSVYGYFPGW